MKCSGKNCPMQYPYDEKACAILETCPYATLIPYTNADRIRSMNDEELEDQLVLEVEGIAPCKMFISIPTGEMFISRKAAKESVGNWLKQPLEEE